MANDNGADIGINDLRNTGMVLEVCANCFGSCVRVACI